MYCSRCGHKLKGDERFCGHCGTATGSTTAANPASLVPEHTSQNKSPTKIAGLAIALCLSVFALIVLVARPFGSHDDPGVFSGSNQDGGQMKAAEIISFDNIDSYVSNDSEALAAILGVSNLLGVQNPESVIGECRVEHILDSTYYRFRQHQNDVPVYGHEIILCVDGNNKATTVVNKLANIGSISAEATISVDGARTAILSTVTDAYLATTPKLVIYDDGSNYELAYYADVSEGDTVNRYFISAIDGGHIASEQLTYDENVGTLYADAYGITAYDASKKEIKAAPETGTDENSQVYTFNIEEDGSYYFVNGHGEQLDDDDGAYYIRLTKAGKIIAEKAGVAEYSFSVGNKTLSPAVVNLQKMSKADDKTMALINNTTAVYDFYSNVLERKSYNGEGGAITLVSNAKLKDLGNGNAYSGNTTPYQTSLVFGFDNPVELDTVGHEFTHSVETSICAMEYSGESGALKEATSDIFGELVEDYSDNGQLDSSCDWIHGGRNMIAPENGVGSERNDSIDGHPSSYRQSGLWGDTGKGSFDNGHVHNNSTVISHAAYLMCSGEIDGEALTTDELARVLFASFGLCTTKCSFALYAGIVERVAQDMLGNAKAERVRAAFQEAGITPIEVVYAAQDAEDGNGEQDEGKLLEGRLAQLSVKDFSVEYLYRARGYDNNPNFEWVVSDDLPDGAVVGADIADFDGDGDDELLAVLWRNDTVDFDMYEVNGNAVKLAASMSDVATLAFPVKGNGTLDIAVDGGGAIFMQWWQHTAPIADYHDWTVMRISYDGKGLTASDGATVAGTGMLSLAELKSDMEKLGLNTDYVPDEDFGDFTTSSITDLDVSLKLISRATAWVDSEAIATSAYREMQSGSSAWGDLKHLGNFRIGPNTSVWGDGGSPSNTAEAHENTSANNTNSTESNADAGTATTGNVAREAPVYGWMVQDPEEPFFGVFVAMADDKNEAERMVEEANQMGFPSRLIKRAGYSNFWDRSDKYKQYLVAVGCYSRRDAAEEIMQVAIEWGYKDAWIEYSGIQL